MSGGLFVALAGLLVAGCVGTDKRPMTSADNKPLRMVRKNQQAKPGDHGLQIIKIIDEQGRERTVYIYVPRGVPRSLIEAIDEHNVAKVLEMSSKERETNTRAALFGARWVTKNTHSKYAPDGFILVAEIYEDMKLFSYAFQAYHEVVSRWPGHERRLEIMERQLAIADRFKDEGLRYKWKLPWQDSVAIPIPRIFTYGRTPELYGQIVANAPYGPLAPEAQFKSGAAHEQAIGFWGGRERYKEAVAAYQLAADRYGRRDMKPDNESLQTAEEVADRSFKALDADGDGRLTRAENPDVFRWHRFTTKEKSDDVITHAEMISMLRKQEEQAARARYHIGQVLESRASDGLYDQTLAEKSIAAYEVFLNYYARKNLQSKFEPRPGFDDAWFKSHVPRAEERIDAMRLEQARGYRAIAEFYERKSEWTAAQKYYSEVVRVTQTEMHGDLDADRQEIYKQAGASFKQLYRKRIEAAVGDFEAARAADRAGRYASALQLYRRAHVGLSLSREVFDENAPAFTDAALRIRARTVEDMRRLDEVITRQRSLGAGGY
jgi:tetratricopeptide (TPR) repeat protein